MQCTPNEEWPSGVKPSGTVIEHPDAFRLVQMGCAEAADPECDKAVQRTPEQLARARAAYDKVSAGIWFEDYAAFDQGIISGYCPDGSYKPGPNYVEPEEEEEEEEE